MLVTALIFLLILSVLVMVHELGHFFAAKRFGIKVEEFGFGLPPRVWGKKFGETIYSINWLPIGGFVKLYGEDTETDEEVKKEKAKHKGGIDRAFFSRPIWQRAVVLTAGVTMNFILAVIVLSYLFTQGVMVPTDRVHVDKTVAGSPAQTAGVQEGDIIKSVRMAASEGQPTDRLAPPVDIKSGEDLIAFTKSNLGKEIILSVDRKGTLTDITLTPRAEYPKTEGPLGIVISNFEEKKYPWYEAPIAGTRDAVIKSWGLLQGIGTTLWKFISFQPVAKDVAGPLGIAQMTGEAIKFGNNAVLELMGLLSLNLAIVNILPFPALDGGRLLFVIIEAISGKRVKANVERYAHQIGMILLLSLILLVTINDLVRIFGK